MSHLTLESLSSVSKTLESRRRRQGRVSPGMTMDHTEEGDRANDVLMSGKRLSKGSRGEP